MNRRTLARAKPHLTHRLGLWSCTTRAPYLARVGRGYTPSTAYLYWQGVPRYIVNCETGHRIDLTGVSNSLHVVTD